MSRTHPARRTRTAVGAIGATSYLALVWVISAEAESPAPINLAASLGAATGGTVAPSPSTGGDLLLSGGATPADAAETTVGGIASDETTEATPAPTDPTVETTAAPSTAAETVPSSEATAPSETTAPPTTAAETTPPSETTAPPSSEGETTASSEATTTAAPTTTPTQPTTTPTTAPTTTTTSSGS